MGIINCKSLLSKGFVRICGRDLVTTIVRWNCVKLHNRNMVRKLETIARAVNPMHWISFFDRWTFSQGP